MGVKRFDDIKISENINHILMDDRPVTNILIRKRHTTLIIT